jgi:thiamine pyrophosphate-dependent acetolactate synthase large subunit-like protein
MIDRYEASKYLVSRLTDEVVVTSLGNEKYDLLSAGDRDRHFYNWNSMGMAPSIGLGLAMARPDLKVIVYDGDGSLLMGLGALATTAVRQPQNFVHIAWDNRVYNMTGGQATFQQAVDRALAEPGPWFIHCLMQDKPVKGGGLSSPTAIKQRFMNAIGARH